MGQKDIISKYVLKHLTAEIANLLLGLDIDADAIELLETEQQRIELRKADLVARVKHRQTEKTFILHVEVQNDHDAEMPLRMLRYFTDIQLAYPYDRIHQYLVYIGKPALRMTDTLDAGAFRYRYRILDMHTVDCDLLIAQDTPDALVLAILCDFKERPVQDVVNFIVRRLHELLDDNEKGFRDYFQMLETLSDNRQLQTHIDEAKNMLTQIEIEKLPSYRWGESKGLEKGVEKGILMEKYRLAKQLLPVMDDQTIATMTGLSLKEIEQLRQGEW